MTVAVPVTVAVASSLGAQAVATVLGAAADLDGAVGKRNISRIKSNNLCQHKDLFPSFPVPFKS